MPENTFNLEMRDKAPLDTVAGSTQGHMVVDVKSRMDLASGEVRWTLSAIDDATGQLPDDALAGILPPENGTGRGQGYVAFTIRPKANLAQGSVITNKASIVFDTRDAPEIVTNEVSNTIGKVTDLSLSAACPTSAKPGEVLTATFKVRNDGPARPKVS